MIVSDLAGGGAQQERVRGQIAAAIRAAQNAVYDAAAQAAEDAIDNGVVIVSACEVGDFIRGLKHPTEARHGQAK